MPAKSDKLWAEQIGARALAGANAQDLQQARPRSHSLLQAEHGRRCPQRPAWRSPETVALLVGALDFSLILAAAAPPLAIYPAPIVGMATEPGNVLTSTLVALLFVGGFERFGGYRVTRLPNLYWQLVNIAKVWGSITLLILFLIGFLDKMSENHPRGWVLAWIIVTPGLLATERGIIRLALARWLKNGHFARNVVIVGAGHEGQQLIARLHALRDANIIIRGVFDDRKSGVPAAVQGVPVLGTTDELLRLVRQYPVDEAIIALPLDEERQLSAVFDKLKGVAIDLRLSATPIAEKLQIRGMSYISEIPVFEIADRPFKSWKAAVKWAEDMFLAAFLLIIFGIPMSVVALLIKLDSPGPVFFAQPRFGFNNRPIQVLKFRTMYVDRGDPSGEQRTVRDDSRVTRIGRLLRKLSIDELPQLINVLRGEMSLVGPRAHAIAMKVGDRLYCEAVEQYLHRHRVKPGITGWAQVNGLRGEVDTPRKARARVAHDLYYIEHWSFWLDLKILLKTACVIATRDKAY